MTENKALKCVIFDIDGTLVDSLYHIVKSVEYACKNSGVKTPTREVIKSGIGLSLENAMKRFVPDVESKIVKKMMNDFEYYMNRDDASDEIKLFDGALETLEKLEKNDYLLAIATGNSSQGTMFSLTSTNIADKFISISNAGNSKSKPNPEMIEKIINETGVEKDNVVIVGDTKFDILMGKNAGVKTLGVSWGYHDVSELEKAGADNIAFEYENVFEKITSLIG